MGFMFEKPKSLEGENNKPFYKRIWFMWLMLIFIPPVGIVLMWLYSDYKKVPKVALSIVIWTTNNCTI